MKIKKLLKFFFSLSLLFCFLGSVDVFCAGGSGDVPPTTEPPPNDSKNQQQENSKASSLFEDADREHFEEQEDTEIFDRERLEP